MMDKAPRLRDTFTGTISKGEFRPDLVGRWRGSLARFEGKRLRVSLESEKKLRSLRSNAYLWVCYAIAEEWCGHDSEELHEYMKKKFLPSHELTLPSGEILTVPGSTKNLTTDEMAEFISKVKRFFAEQGLYLPDPNEVY